MDRPRTQFKSSSRDHPCPLCEGIDGCNVGKDGLILCRRREGAQAGFICLGKAKGDPQWAQFRREGDPLLNENHRPAPTLWHKHKVNWGAKAQELARNLTSDCANALAQALGLPQAVLSELPLLGFCANGPHKDDCGNSLGGCWTFPEFDSAGNVVGLICRYRNGTATNDKRNSLGFRWEPIDSTAFAAADYRPAWLAKKALVEKQVAVIGGPQKVLKTSLAIDLAVSLASATPWLGEFACPTLKRAAVLSGESGPWALQAMARRVCTAKGIDLAALGENLRWQFALPQLGVLEQLDALRVGLERDRVEVVIIDPLYLCLLAGAGSPRAENLYDIGPLLLLVAQTCLRAGATPIFLHHTTKPTARKLEPLDLTDLAFSGVAEFARQWVLISRREAYDADAGTHHLWLSIGGSVGHGGLWAVDVEEGQLAEDFTGRKWQVTVTAAGAARKAERESREEEKAKRKEADAETDARQVLHSHRVNDPDNEGVSYSRLRDSTGLSAPRFGAAVTRLKDTGEIIETPGTATVGNRARRPARILRRRPSEDQLPTLEETLALPRRRKGRAKKKKRRGRTTKEQPSENNRQCLRLFPGTSSVSQAPLIEGGLTLDVPL